MPLYKVLIDDNYHYMDAEARYEHGRFDTAEQAVAACRKIVDAGLREQYKPGMSAAVLFHLYENFGDDPFIVPLDRTAPDMQFSASDYAQEQCQLMCATDQAQSGNDAPAAPGHDM